MNQPFVERSPTETEIEKLRLLLSTFQDGTGMLQISKNTQRTLPGWRDFERSVALTFAGIAIESKFFVDVIFPLSEGQKTFYGVDCKMRDALRTVENHNRIYVEVTNAARQLWSYLYTKGITESNFRDMPELAGNNLIEAIEAMKNELSSAYPDGNIITTQSYYLVLLWDRRTGTYQLYQLPLELPNPGNLNWNCHVSLRRDGTETTRLVGEDDNGVLYEWYGGSGGQFKYYPIVTDALWISNPFHLEPLNESIEIGLVEKAKSYFPDKWHNLEN